LPKTEDSRQPNAKEKPKQNSDTVLLFQWKLTCFITTSHQGLVSFSSDLQIATPFAVPFPAAGLPISEHGLTVEVLMGIEPADLTSGMDELSPVESSSCHVKLHAVEAVLAVCRSALTIAA
jgi:hypothetical protein